MITDSSWLGACGTAVQRFAKEDGGDVSIQMNRRRERIDENLAPMVGSFRAGQARFGTPEPRSKKESKT